jgi:hypothetical protein
VKFSDLVRAIKEAREAGLPDVEAKLRSRLDRLIDEEARESPSPGSGGWIDVPDEGGTTFSKVLPGETLPSFSARHRRIIDRYFREAEHQMQDDEDRLREMLEDVED